MPKAKQKSPTYFEEEPEIRPKKALKSDPDFMRRHLLGAPNMRAVAALLAKDQE